MPRRLFPRADPRRRKRGARPRARTDGHRPVPAQAAAVEIPRPRRDLRLSRRAEQVALSGGALCAEGLQATASRWGRVAVDARERPPGAVWPARASRAVEDRRREVCVCPRGRAGRPGRPRRRAHRDDERGRRFKEPREAEMAGRVHRATSSRRREGRVCPARPRRRGSRPCGGHRALVPAGRLARQDRRLAGPARKGRRFRLARGRAYARRARRARPSRRRVLGRRPIATRR